MRLLVFTLTVGEEIIFEAFDALRATTPVEYDIKVWYDTCGRGIKEPFLKRLLEYTPDVILSYRDQGLGNVEGWMTLYACRNYDAVFFVPPDGIMQPGWWDKFQDVVKGMPKWGMIGDLWRDVPFTYDKLVNDYAFCPDGTLMINREAIDASGGTSPSFQGRGPVHFELCRRLHANGYGFVSVHGWSIHGGEKHAGRDMDPRWREDLHRDNLVWLRTTYKENKHYNWWSAQN